jgi:hypothetical protein
MLDEMKRDIEKLKSETADARATSKLIIRTLVRIESKVDEGFSKMATKDDVSIINGKIAGLAGKLEEMKLDWAHHHDRLNAHDKRLSRLEEPHA